jgi:hypothetical protein
MAPDNKSCHIKYLKCKKLKACENALKHFLLLSMLVDFKNQNRLITYLQKAE